LIADVKGLSENSGPRIAVMILNFNRLDFLQSCLASIPTPIPPNVSIYVIDNGSTDGSTRFVRKRYPRIKLITFTRNLGFAEAYNRAIAQVEADYILMLNNDTAILSSSWIRLLARHLERDAATAACGCKLVTMRDHRVLDSVGVMGIKYWRGFVDIGKYEKDQHQYDRPAIVPFSLCGAAMLVRRSTFLRVNGFDSKFHSYVEDVDLCWRLRLIGLKLAYEPAAKVAHYFSASRATSDLDPEKLYLSHRNLLRAIIKNCGSSSGWALRNYFLFTFMLILGFAVFEPRKAVAVVKAVLWNVIHLKDTLSLRVIVQGTRTVPDEDILPLMFPSVNRYQPVEHSRLRHLLDTLFERSRQPVPNPVPSRM